MPTPVVLPKQGMTMEEGTLERWIAADGATVSPGDPLFEMSTEKISSEIVAEVAGAAVRAGCAGVLRGLIHPGVYVAAGMKIGDVDPRGVRDHCFVISDKSLAVAGGVLEALLAGMRHAE
jgi:hypothetical protein